MWKDVGGEEGKSFEGMITLPINFVFYFYGNRLASQVVAKGDSSYISNQGGNTCWIILFFLLTVQNNLNWDGKWAGREDLSGKNKQ